MRAIVLDSRGVSFTRDYPEPAPRDGEVRVRVLRAGICDTDLQLIRGYMSFRGVLGHEFVGIAESGPFAGSRVVSEINCSCGRCATCRAGRRSHCENRTVLGIRDHDGAFADFISVPHQNLHRVPDVIATDAAAFTEPVAAAFEIPVQLDIRPSDRVAVLGDGRLGNLCGQVLSTLTPHLLVVGKHQEKLDLLKSFGVATALLADIPLDASMDIVVDCTGSKTGLPTALELVRPRGTIFLKTTVAGIHNLALAPIVIKEVTVIGSRCGPFDRALAALARGDIQVAPLISQRFDLSRGVEALETARTPPVLKVLLDVANE